MTYGHGCSGCGNYSSGAGSYSSSSGNYSGLESVVSSYQGSQGFYSSSSHYNISESRTQDYTINLDSATVPLIYENKTDEKIDYKGKESERQYNITTNSGMIFTPAPFLKKNRPYTVFVGQAYEIQDFIKDAFRATTGNELPKDVAVEVCSKERLREIHESFGGRWSNNIQGFAINKKHIGDDSLVFIASGPLDKVMLTIGHEIGHVMSVSLFDKKAEEAKAFAFSIAWMKAIKENNIAGLADSIELDEPARNGLHNVALEFVLDAIKAGKDSLNIFNELSNCVLNFNSQIYM